MARFRSILTIWLILLNDLTKHHLQCLKTDSINISNKNIPRDYFRHSIIFVHLATYLKKNPLGDYDHNILTTMTLCKQKPENPDRKCLHFPKTLRLRKITGYIGKLTFAYVNLVFCLPKQISIEQCLEFKLVKSGIRLIPRSGELSWRRTE